MVLEVVVVVVLVVALAVADEDHTGHGHVYGHDLLRLSRDHGVAPSATEVARGREAGGRPRVADERVDRGWWIRGS